MYVVSEATRSSCKFQNFPRGTCPQTPLVWICCCTLEFPPLLKDRVLIPNICIHVECLHRHISSCNHGNEVNTNFLCEQVWGKSGVFVQTVSKLTCNQLWRPLLKWLHCACMCNELVSTWTTYRYIHKHSNFLIQVISVGLASARPSYVYVWAHFLAHIQITLITVSSQTWNLFMTIIKWPKLKLYCMIEQSYNHCTDNSSLTTALFKWLNCCMLSHTHPIITHAVQGLSDSKVYFIQLV